jgi:hypothetical protein
MSRRFLLAFAQKGFDNGPTAAPKRQLFGLSN